MKFAHPTRLPTARKVNNSDGSNGVNISGLKIIVVYTELQCVTYATKIVLALRPRWPPFVTRNSPFVSLNEVRTTKFVGCKPLQRPLKAMVLILK